MLTDYIVNLWGNEVAVKSETSRNAIACALVRNKIPLGSVKIVKPKKQSSRDTRVQVTVKDVTTNKVEKFRLEMLNQ